MGMKIEHVAVYFNDLERGKEFFERYFGATEGELYHNPRTGFSSYFRFNPKSCGQMPAA